MPDDCTKILRAALAYFDLGLTVIPIGRDKKPLVRWRRFQTVRPARATVEEWFEKRPDANVAVVLGPISGKDGLGLVCRDFDVADSYRVWQAENPALALTLPTSKGSRGFHVFILSDAGASKTYPDGELKGLGALAVLPPSVHASGVVYEWVNPIGAEIPKADAAIFARPFCFGETQDSADGADSTDSAENTGRLNDNSGTFPRPSAFENNHGAEVPACLDDAIELSLPTGPGQRHDCIFAFCRALRGMPQYADADPADLWDEFSAWFERAEPFIGTKDVVVSWEDFLEGFPLVEHPMGRDAMTAIAERAEKLPIPAFVKRFGASAEPMGKLVNLCGELQSHAGQKPFFLSARKAAEVLGMGTKRAWTYLRVLECEGILKCEERGKPGLRQRATTWRYVGPSEKKLKSALP